MKLNIAVTVEQWQMVKLAIRKAPISYDMAVGLLKDFDAQIQAQLNTKKEAKDGKKKKRKNS